MTTLSIIIVTYNSEEEIVNCINSLLPQMIDLTSEIIIIDNNSTDNTISLLNEIEYKNISTIQNSTNVGYTIANNQGIKKALGEYLLFLNPDTLVLNDVVNNLL